MYIVFFIRAEGNGVSMRWKKASHHVADFKPTTVKFCVFERLDFLNARF